MGPTGGRLDSWRRAQCVGRVLPNAKDAVRVRSMGLCVCCAMQRRSTDWPRSIISTLSLLVAVGHDSDKM
jgi:hypothetical protein